MTIGTELLPSVLLADSNDEFRKHLRQLLKDEGYEVYEAIDKTQIFEVLKRQPIDKIIVALDLKDEDDVASPYGGLTLAESGRQELQNIPIIFVGDVPEWDIVRKVVKGRFCEDWVRRSDGPETVLRSIMPTPIILHISDLQFGPYQREMTINPSQRTRNPIELHIEKIWYDLSEKLKVQPNILVVTGDITEHGLPRQFEEAEDFIKQLARRMSVPIQRVVITPGNHDICWPDSRAAFLKAAYARCGAVVDNAESDEALKTAILNEDILFQKFTEYERFYNGLYDGKHKFEPRLYDVFDFRNLNILMVSLNSCVRACHLDRQGWIGNDQVSKAGDEMNRLDPHHHCLRMGIFHHHVVAKTKGDYDDRVEDFEKIAPALQKYNFRLLMHGHQHKSDAYNSQRIGDRPVPILAGGSLLLRKEKTVTGSQYQVLEVRNKKSRLYLRCYNPDRSASSGLGDGEWVPDTSFPNANNDGIIEFQI